jgi:hypothetical protein
MESLFEVIRQDRRREVGLVNTYDNFARRTNPDNRILNRTLMLGGYKFGPDM